MIITFQFIESNAFLIFEINVVYDFLMNTLTPSIIRRMRPSTCVVVVLPGLRSFLFGLMNLSIFDWILIIRIILFTTLQRRMLGLFLCNFRDQSNLLNLVLSDNWRGFKLCFKSAFPKSRRISSREHLFVKVGRVKHKVS